MLMSKYLKFRPELQAIILHTAHMLLILKELTVRQRGGEQRGGGGAKMIDTEVLLYYWALSESHTSAS